MHIDELPPSLRSFLTALAVVLTASACAAVPPPAPRATVPPVVISTTLKVFAAASLTDVFDDMATAFEAAHAGVQVVYNFAGSQQLAQQIAEGGDADVFASANAQQMNSVIKAGKVISGSQQVFARNRLVVILPKDNPAKLQSLADLQKPKIRLVLAAKEVPVGQYALDFLDKAVKQTEYGPGYKEAVLKNVVSYEDNVRAVLAKVSLGEADAGIVYTTDVTGDAANKVSRMDIPDALNTVATYPIATVSGSKNAALAQQFVAYVLSPEGQATLAKYGFITAGPGSK